MTAEHILARAIEVAPALRERAEEIERERRLPADVVELLRGTGVFRMAYPAGWGGTELTSAEQTRVIETLATGDPSAAWCAMIGMDSGIYAGFLAEDAARELFGDPDTITAGLILPLGTATRVPGGFRVSGRWAFGSGITHADRLFGGVSVVDEAEPERWRIIVARPADVEILDTWHTTGLAGSGSRDYQVADLFVPAEHTFSFHDARKSWRTGPLATPDAILRNMPGVPLGTARAALDHVRGLAAGRVDRAAGVPWAESYRVQLTVAVAEAELGAARDAVYGSLDRLWTALESGAEPTVDERVAAVLARTNAFRVARDIVSRLVDLVATTAIYRPSPLDRWLRDLTTMRQHVIAQDQVFQSAGALLLGGTPHNPFALGLVD